MACELSIYQSGLGDTVLRKVVLCISLYLKSIFLLFALINALVSYISAV